MFSDGVRVNGVKLMATHGVKEGIVAGAKLVSEDRWGSHNRIQNGVPAMAGYGSSIKDHLPMMKQMIEQRYAKDEANRKKMLALLDEIAEANSPQKLVSIAQKIEEAEEKADKRSE